MTNKVLEFGINTSCIKGIKSTYKAKVGTKCCRMRGMTEYQEAKKKVKREARREASRTRAALVSESRAGAAKEHPVRRTLLAQRPITLVLMMINSCSYSTNDLVFI